jgi:hypothetical protein
MMAIPAKREEAPGSSDSVCSHYDRQQECPTSIQGGAACDLNYSNRLHCMLPVASA